MLLPRLGAKFFNGVGHFLDLHLQAPDFINGRMMLRTMPGMFRNFPLLRHLSLHLASHLLKTLGRLRQIGFAEMMDGLHQMAEPVCARSLRGRFAVLMEFGDAALELLRFLVLAGAVEFLDFFFRSGQVLRGRRSLFLLPRVFAVLAAELVGFVSQFSGFIVAALGFQFAGALHEFLSFELCGVFALLSEGTAGHGQCGHQCKEWNRFHEG